MAFIPKTKLSPNKRTVPNIFVWTCSSKTKTHILFCSIPLKVLFIFALILHSFYIQSQWLKQFLYLLTICCLYAPQMYVFSLPKYRARSLNDLRCIVLDLLVSEFFSFFHLSILYVYCILLCCLEFSIYIWIRLNESALIIWCTLHLYNNIKN